MDIFIIFYGALTSLVGLIILFNPHIIIGYLSQRMENIWLYIFAIMVRLILGTFLIIESGESGYPIAIELLGWFLIIAGLVLIAIGRQNFQRLVSWALSLAKSIGRVGGFLAICLGGFLVYAFV